jgi:acetyltransferase
MRTDIGFNATFAMGGALPGSLALVSQSGALCTAMLDWARPHRVGFSSVVSLGGSSDIYFGEVIDFLAVEIHRDRAIALPPLNEFLVDELIDGTRSSRLLGAFRNLPPVDRQALRDVLLRLSEMVCELACLDELDINPLIIDEQGVVIADARVVVRALPGRPGQYRHMAIHPYPANLVESWRGRNGEMVTLRPIRPEDAEIEQEFVRGLSAESRHFRFMDTLRELTPSMLLRLTQIDYDREMAFIATVGRDNREVEIGVCRYVSNPDGRTCEFAIVVADDWQKQGLGRRMMDQLIAVATERGLSAMMGHVLRGNSGMLTLCERLGFREEVVQLDHSVVRLTLDLHTW